MSEQKIKTPYGEKNWSFIKRLMDDETKRQSREQKIIVYVRGGVVEDVKKIPEDLEVIVEVHDYDEEEDEDPENNKHIRLDDGGAAFGLTQY